MHQAGELGKSASIDELIKAVVDGSCLDETLRR